jgi:CHAT domain-containing protein
VGASDGSSVQLAADGSVIIPPDLALKLKGRSNTFDSSSIDTAGKIRVRIAQVELTEATSLDAIGETAKARALLDDAHAILSQRPIAGLEPWLDAQLDAELARQDETAGHPADAQKRLNDALIQLRQRQAGSSAEAFLLLDIGRLDALAGHKEQAMGDYQAAIALFRESRGSLGASADTVAPYLDLLIAQTKADPAHAQDYNDRFMTTLQTMGSLTTAQVVAKLSAKLAQGDKGAGGLVRAYEETRRVVRAKESEIAQLQSQGLYTPAKKAGSEAELKGLKDQQAELFSRVLTADPKYGQRITADVSLKDLQAALKPGELYVKVALVTTQGYVLAVTSDSATPYKIDLGKTAAGDIVNRLRKPFETEGYLPRFDVAGSHTLFTRLFTPIQDRMLHARQIIYEPDETLLAFPIAALVTDQASVDMMTARRKAARARGEADAPYDNIRWLGRTADTSLVVSAASFVQARKFTPSAGKHAFLGFGDPALPTPDNARAFRSVGDFQGADVALCNATKDALFALQPLKETGPEIKAVGDSINPSDAQIVTGEAFSDGAVSARKDLDQYRVLFFATHGLLPSKKDCLPEPALLTSASDDGSEGLLSASKIASLSLDADLVVLSACDTGGGLAAGIQDKTGLEGSGEALSGLTRAFIYAGARSLIVSHWSVDVHAMVGLMTSTFASGAPTLSEAVRQADLKMMDSGDAFSHPYYWAAFTVVGDGARPMPVR